MAYTSSIFPGAVPDGFFDSDNIEFIREKAASLLKREFVQTILFDNASVVRIMQRVLEERLEPVPRMNERVLMYLCNEFRNHQSDLHKKMKWEEHYIESQRLYDPTVERGPDMGKIKLANRLGKPRVGGTVRFMFI
jgi:hypothetical protein